MALRPKVVLTKAAKAEQKEEIKHELNPERIPAFNEMLHNVYATRRPQPSDYSMRKDLVRVFNDMAKELYGNSNAPVVVEFGSFTMDIFDSSSDLDLSVNFGDGSVQLPRDKRIQTLRKFARKLYSLQKSGHVTQVLPITTAKVPILKVVDCGTAVECDISIENWDGISKSRIINLISLIDYRFPKLSFLMKAWAKAHNINSSKDRTLNSLSIVLLVAFHLQTRNPPILPPFSALLKDGSDPEAVKKLCTNLTGYGSGNTETLGELFVSLLVKLSAVEILWPKGLCASAYEGSWASKTWNSKVAWISVEDFTDRSQNVARAVGESEVKTIYKCIKLSVRHLSGFLDGQIEGSRLIELLFGNNVVPTAFSPGIPTVGVASAKRKKKKGKKRKPIMSNSVLENKPRLVDSREATSTGSWIGSPAVAEPQTTPVLSHSVLEKRPCPVDSLAGTSTDSWIGAPSVAEQQTRPILSHSVLEKRPRPVDSWAGTSTDSLVRAPSVAKTKGKGKGKKRKPILSNSVLEKRQHAVDSSGGTSTGNWIGARAVAEQKTRPILSHSVLEKRPHPVDSWAGTSTGVDRARGAKPQTWTHHAGSWGQAPIGIQQPQYITGWGVTQPHPGAWDGRVPLGPTWAAPSQQASSWGWNADVQQASAWGRNADVQRASAWGRNADVQRASGWGRNADVQQATGWGRNADVQQASAWGRNADVQQASVWGRYADVQQASVWGRNVDVQRAWGRNVDVQQASAWGRNADIRVTTAPSSVSHIQMQNQVPAALNYAAGHHHSSVPLLQQKFHRE